MRAIRRRRSPTSSTAPTWRKGQTGLSVAFDLPTQTGYDSDHILARGEVGKVGVPVGHLGDMRALFDGIPLEQMNTSMTINAPAAWLLALYVALAEEQGADPSKLTGTTQNDILKEYLSRGTYIFPPAPSLKLTADTIAWSLDAIPKWNPMNVCSYHLQEAGATPEQELAFALAAAIAVLDEVKARGEVAPERFADVFSRISFFVNAGLRFVTEISQDARVRRCSGTRSGRERYGVDRREGAPLPLWRAGELAGADRAAGGEQRLSHPARDAGRHAVERARAPARCSCRRGTKRWACRGRGTSNGRCGCSRSSPTRPTCSSSRTSSTARRSSTPRSRELTDGARAELAQHRSQSAARRAALDYMKGGAGRVQPPPHRSDRARRG